MISFITPEVVNEMTFMVPTEQIAFTGKFPKSIYMNMSTSNFSIGAKLMRSDISIIFTIFIMTLDHSHFSPRQQAAVKPSNFPIHFKNKHAWPIPIHEFSICFIIKTLNFDFEIFKNSNIFLCYSFSVLVINSNWMSLGKLKISNLKSKKFNNENIS